MDVIDFLAIAIIDQETEMITQAQFFGYELRGFIKQSKNFRRCGLKIYVFHFGDYEEMDSILWVVVGDDDHVVGFMENPGWKLTFNDACEYRWHSLR